MRSPGIVGAISLWVIAVVPAAVSAQEPAAAPDAPPALPQPPPSPPAGRPSNDPYGTASLYAPPPPSAPWYRTGVAPDRERPPVAAPMPAASPPGDDAANIPGAILGGVLGYGLGIATAALLIAASVEGGSDGEVLIITAPLALLAMGTGCTAGIVIGGDAGGGDGSFWGTFGGQALGVLASLMVALMTLSGGDDDDWIGVGAILTFPIIGGVIAYEMGDQPERPRR